MAFDFGYMNPEQIEAVKHKDGPCVVTAGAGSGKTKVLSERIHYLIQEYNVNPENILAITFTKKAAGEMQERVIGLVGAEKGKKVLLCTFHSFGFKIIRYKYRRENKEVPSIFMETEQKQILNKILSKSTTVLSSPIQSEIDADTALSFISWQKNYLIMPNDELDTSCLDDSEEITEDLIEDFRTIYRTYEKLKKQENGIDMDDMLVETYWILKRDAKLRAYYQNLYKYILVDEFQDTNVAQYKLIKLLASGYYQNVFVVGDARQAIYSWRASKVDFILNFTKDWKNARSIELNDNYRSTVEVVEMSTLSIKHSEINYPGICRSGRGNHGNPIFSLFSDDENMEAETIANIIKMMVEEQGLHYSDIAILYRLNAQSRPFEDAFSSNEIPFYVAGSPGYYGRREIQELLCYLKLAINPNDFDSFKTIANIPNRNISKDDLLSLESDSIKYSISILDTVIGFADKYKSEELLKDFGLTIQKIQAMNADENCTVEDILTELCENSGYYDFIKERMKGKMKTKADEDNKVESLKSFVNSCSKFKTIEKLFDHIQKVAEQQDSNQKDKVQMMSLHKSKGLEFNTVFMVGMTNGLLPHGKSMKIDGNGKIIPASIEEERRLCYVGITRAKETLFLSSYYNQGKNPTEVSIFLKEIYPFTKDASSFAKNVKEVYEAKLQKEDAIEEANK